MNIVKYIKVNNKTLLLFMIINKEIDKSKMFFVKGEKM
jgi:hypothetical protein